MQNVFPQSQTKIKIKRVIFVSEGVMLVTPLNQIPFILPSFPMSYLFPVTHSPPLSYVMILPLF